MKKLTKEDRDNIDPTETANQIEKLQHQYTIEYAKLVYDFTSTICNVVEPYIFDTCIKDEINKIVIPLRDLHLKYQKILEEGQ